MDKDSARGIKISDYNYVLPDEKIAKYPLDKRSESKLLHYKDGEISSFRFYEIDRLIPENSLVIFNNTKVIHARLFFRKPTGAVIEVFCLTPHLPREYQQNFEQRERCVWSCMVGNAKRWREDSLDMEFDIDGAPVVLTARKVENLGGEWLVEFSWDNHDYTFSELLEVIGKLPIPPYLNRESEEKDDETYQTVYSVIEGSVAAPTAGLHFTPDTFEALENKNVNTAYVTLHVGAGTFRPVKSESMAGHDMHTEFIALSRDTIQQIYSNNSPLIVVGTTSLRTVESLYYIGVKIINNPDIDVEDLGVSQWEPYDVDGEVGSKESLKAVLDYMDRRGMSQLVAETKVIIVPGYKFHFPQAIITNFHQPESTLLLLIAAFAGSDWSRIYDYALSEDYRFLSYGDSSMIWMR